MSGFPRFSPEPNPFGVEFLPVSELTEQIKDSLESDFATVAVLGEVSNLARPRSGHIYFSLKDEAASMRAVMWRGDAQRLAFDLTDGLAVRLVGKLTVYAPRGEYQVIVTAIEPDGMGAQELAFRQLFARLTAEGLFDTSRKKPLPRFPRTIVVVSSPTGAAVRDVLQVTGRRWGGTNFLVAPTRVQGPGAAGEIANAIALANRVSDSDLIILARGGGSVEDLGAFNEEVVVRAVAGSRVPVVSAVGHEIDVTLADLAADRRALTPSEAGELVVPDAREFAMHLDHLAERLHRVSRSRLVEACLRLERLADRLRYAIEQDLAARRSRLDRRSASLHALSPISVLARGYSLTFLSESGSLVRSPDQVRPGQQILTRLSTGEFTSLVTAPGRPLDSP